MTTDSLHQEAYERAKKVGIDTELMEVALRQQRKDRPYVVELESKPGGVFFRCTQEGPSKVLYINTAHNFFLEGYMVPGSTPRYRAGIEIFLWILGTSELEAEEKDRKVYQAERVRWSGHLHQAFKLLAQINDHEGAREAETLEEEEEEE